MIFVLSMAMMLHKTARYSLSFKKCLWKGKHLGQVVTSSALEGLELSAKRQIVPGGLNAYSTFSSINLRYRGTNCTQLLRKTECCSNVASRYIVSNTGKSRRKGGVRSTYRPDESCEGILEPDGNEAKSINSAIIELLARDEIVEQKTMNKTAFKVKEDDLTSFLHDHPDANKSNLAYETVTIDDSDEYLDDGDYQVLRDEHNKPRVALKPPDPDIPASKVPCPGCGALLHCQQIDKPGFLPKERFLSIPKKKLRDSYCTRCRMLAKHKAALAVSVTPEDYIKIIEQVKKVRALFLLVVDVMDFPNSLIKQLPRLIGGKRPMIVVGNKIDLLPRDGEGYLRRTCEMIASEMDKYRLFDRFKVLDIQLVSAKTGYGIEELVSKLMVDWSISGHVYILGTTNSGKSSLFNALLSSDYCKDSARDYINRATISNWPGTTMNMLKFPIINPSPWRLERRSSRLKKLPELVEEMKLRRQKYDETKDDHFLTLVGNVGQTFLGTKMAGIEEQAARYAGYTSPTFGYKAGAVQELQSSREELYESIARAAGVDEYHEGEFLDAKWCFDSPGVVQPSQLINKLNQDEIDFIEGQVLNYPRTFRLMKGQVMFLSGLGRIDMIEGPWRILVTVIAAPTLPVHIVSAEDADDFYREFVGDKEMLRIPIGNRERLDQLPSLIGREMTVTGNGVDVSCGDVILSSLGWVAVSVERGEEVKLRSYTPGGAGCLLRTPSLLPYAVAMRGKRIGVRGEVARYKVGVKSLPVQ